MRNFRLNMIPLRLQRCSCNGCSIRFPTDNLLRHVCSENCQSLNPVTNKWENEWYLQYIFVCGVHIYLALEVEFICKAQEMGYRWGTKLSLRRILWIHSWLFPSFLNMAEGANENDSCLGKANNLSLLGRLQVSSSTGSKTFLQWSCVPWNARSVLLTAAEYANQTPFAVTTSSEGGKLTVTLSHCALRFLYNSKRT